MITQENQPEKKDAKTENPEKFIKEMMEQRKLQQEALNKIMLSIDTTEERAASAESETEEKKLLQRIFKNKK